MNELALFSGIGGGILGGKLLGWKTVCAVELNPFCRRVLMQRQNDRMLPPFPIWDDVRTFDGNLWKGIVDVVSGGFPCQDISVAGKGKGLSGQKSGLWKEMFRIICEVRPRFVFVENSPALTSRGLGDVLGNLASVGYDAKWGVFGAYEVGAPHKRDRIWILAYVNNSEEFLANSNGSRCEKQRGSISDEKKYQTSECGDWWASEPDVGRMAHGIPFRVDRLKALGNAQVPRVAQEAFIRNFIRLT